MQLVLLLGMQKHFIHITPIVFFSLVFDPSVYAWMNCEKFSCRPRGMKLMFHMFGVSSGHDFFPIPTKHAIPLIAHTHCWPHSTSHITSNVIFYYIQMSFPAFSVRLPRRNCKDLWVSVSFLVGVGRLRLPSDGYFITL